MRRLALALVVSLPLTTTVACAGNPGPGQEGYPYNVEGEYTAAFTASDGFTYVGSVRLATTRGGSVEGEMRLDDPLVVSGGVTGTLMDDRLELVILYEIPENGCTGSVTGSGTVAEGGSPIEGTAEIASDCDAPPEATFRFTR